MNPAETNLYYLQSRYYDPETGRFINADDIFMLGENGDFASLNLYAYCGNNPISRRDASGHAWETVLDIISLASSIAEVAANPANPWAWAGLIGDIVDVAVPFVGGVGETTRLLRATINIADAVDDVHDAGKVADIAQIATKGTPNEIGKIGEKLAGIDASAKVPIQINGRTRIPDAMTDSSLIEVKNVKYISNTQQLKDFADYANATGKTLELYVRPTTTVAKTVTKAGWNIHHLW